MATQTEKKLAYEQWKEHCERVQSITDTSVMAHETLAEQDRRKQRLLNNYAAFCEYYFPHYLTLRDKTTGEVIRTVHNAPFHNAAAVKVRNTPNLKAVFQWPRGHAKSTHFDIFIPIWLMFQPKRLINVMVVVGKSEDSAVYAAYLIYRSNELTAIQRLYDLAVVMCTYFVRVINAEPADNRNYCNCDQRHP